MFTDGLKDVNIPVFNSASDANENSPLLDQLNAGNWETVTFGKLISEIRDRRYVPIIEENVMKIEEESA